MTTFSVDYTQLSMAAELLDRQRDHSEKLKQYLDAQCRLEASSFGFLLQMLHPVNGLVVDTGKYGATLIGDASRWAGQNTRASLNSYLDADREAYAEANALLRQLGTGASPFPVSPSDFPRLGGAASSADADYGTSHSAKQLDFDYILTAADSASDGADLVSHTVATTVDRLSHLTGRGGVVERSDPSSYLVAPETKTDNFVEELRWNAGLILGSIDWVLDQILGYSVLEEYVLKPFGGDWQAIGRASAAWGHGGQNLMETAGNFSGLPGQTSGWVGDAANAYQLVMAAMSAATVALSYAYDAVSGMVDLVVTAARLACAAVASAIGLIETIVLLIIPQLTIPVAGWITATVTAMTQIRQVLMIVKGINMAINALMDAINEFIAAREKIAQAAFMAEDLVNSVVTRAVRA